MGELIRLWKTNKEWSQERTSLNIENTCEIKSREDYFEKRKLKNITDIFLQADIEHMEIFFIYFETLQCIFVVQKEYFERRKNNTLIEFDRELDAPLIHIPDSCTKIEVIDVIYQALLFHYKWEIPDTHPFFALCEKFYQDWIIFYRKNHLKSYNSKILYQIIEEHLSCISFDLAKLFKNMSVTKENIANITNPKNNFLNFTTDIFRVTKNHIHYIIEHSEDVSNQQYFRLGHLSMEVQDFEQAILYFKIALEESPDDFLAIQQNIAICLYKLNRFDEAQEIFEKVYNTDNTCITSLKYLCLIWYQNASEIAEESECMNELVARQILKQVLIYLEQDRDDEVLDVAGSLYMALWNYEEAKKLFQEILLEYPDDLGMKFKIIEIHFLLKDFDAMLKRIQEYLDEETDNSQIWYLLSSYYLYTWKKYASEIADIIWCTYDAIPVKKQNTRTKKIQKFIDWWNDERVLQYFQKALLVNN